MEIVFLRHGEAESFASNDKERKLTLNGKIDIEKISNRLKYSSEKFDVIFSSPVIRAYETANIVATILDLKEKLIIDSRLACGARLSEIREIFNENKTIHSALFVGHCPDIEIISQELLGLSEQPHFTTGGCLKLETPFLRMGTAKLIYFFHPININNI